MQDVVDAFFVVMDWLTSTQFFGLGIIYWFLIFGVVSLICGFIKGRGSNGTKTK